MAACPAWSYDIRLAIQPVSASRARDFVRQRLAEQGLERLEDDVTLVVSELATNAMVHAQTPFTVCLQAFERTLLLEVEDGCRTAPVLLVARGLETNGRGLSIVSLLSRDWGVNARSDGGKSVWAEFDLV
jgi:anti-sigma regulatory factor (Ser/Thr protein kinase)